MTPALATHGLTRAYGRHLALDSVSLTVEPGSVYALVGPNGAGKTTLIQLLMNLQQASRGSAEILGAPAASLRGRALTRVGYVSESQELPDYLSVRGFLDFLRPFYPTWDRTLEAQLLADFALPADRKLRHLSRGMRMKAAFIGALAYRPALLVLDEPFSGLDPLTRDELIQSIVGGLLDRLGETTLFLSSHDLAEIESFSSHVGYLEQGALLFSEDLGSLSGRFRTVEFTLGSDAASLPMHTLPASWLGFARSGSLVRFTHSRFTGPGDAVAEIRAVLPAAQDITFAPLSLREIFLATARSHRAARSAAFLSGVSVEPAPSLHSGVQA